MKWNVTGRPNAAETAQRHMLSSRSARLAATLLLALLFGWTVRACRKGEATTTPPPAPPIAVPLYNTPPNTFPDE